MKQILLTFLAIYFAFNTYSQTTLQNSNGFIGYIYSQNGNLIYQPNTPSSDFFFYGEYGISYATIERENTSTISIGFQLKPTIFFVGNFGITSDEYSFQARGDVSKKAEVSVSTFTPYIGIRKYFELREKLYPYIEIGYSKRFTTAKTSNYYDDELRADYESSIEEILSPSRWNLEAGLDYNFYEYISVGFSTVVYYESREGKGINSSGSGEQFYDFERSRIGQIYNLKLTLHY